MGTACRNTWSESSAAIWNAAFWPTVLRARCAECGHDFLIAFSCKGRGVCPACNARRMVETPAHLVDQVFAPLPLRQWVLSVPKRLRYFLQRDPEALGAVLHILLRVIEARLGQHSACARQLATVTFRVKQAAPAAQVSVLSLVSVSTANQPLFAMASVPLGLVLTP